MLWKDNNIVRILYIFLKKNYMIVEITFTEQVKSFTMLTSKSKAFHESNIVKEKSGLLDVDKLIYFHTNIILCS